MSQFQLFVGGVDYSDLMIVNTLIITESLQANGQTLACDIQKILGDSRAVPLTGQEVLCYRGVASSGGALEYAGRINSNDHKQPNTLDNLRYSLTCVDYTADIDTHLLYQQLASDLAGNVIDVIVGLVGRGFTTNNVDTGPFVGGLFMNYDTPSSFITQIAQSVQYNWYVDYNRDVNFFYILARPAPVPVIYLDTDTDTYFDIEITEDMSQIKNVIYLTGAQVRSNVQDNIVQTSDGNQKFYALGYQPWSVSNDDIRVSVDGAPQIIKTDGVDGSAGDGTGSEGEVYVCVPNWGVRFPDNAPPKQDASVKIEYNYVIDPIIRMEDATSIAIMKARENTATAPSDGEHHFKFEIPELRVVDESTINDYGNVLLTRYAKPIYNIAFHSWVQGWRPGQNLRIVSPTRGLDLTVYILTVQKKVIQKVGALFEYTINCSTSPFPV